MCKNHNIVTGSDAVMSFHEARKGWVEACPARLSYLQRQAMSFHQWVGEQAWCKNATEFCANLVAQTEWMHKRSEDDVSNNRAPDCEMSEILVGNSKELEPSKDDRMECIQESDEKFEGMLHNIAYNGFKKGRLQDMQEIFDWTQDFCDRMEVFFTVGAKQPLPKEVYLKVREVSNRLDILRHGKGVTKKDEWYKHARLSKPMYGYLRNRLNALLSKKDDQFGDQQTLWEEIHGLNEPVVEEDVHFGLAPQEVFVTI